MKFGLFYELQLPKPYDSDQWDPDAERRIYHEMLDQVPVVFVIRAPGEKRSEAEHAAAILERCRAKLADFKVPRAVWFRDAFPVATLEKVAKNKLREIADEMPDPGEGKR